MGDTARIGFFGTPSVSVPALDVLLAADDLEVAVVVTNPDRAKGRSGTPVPPPVKLRALDAGVPILQPDHPSDVVEELLALDLAAVAIVAYGAILPQPVLAAGGAGFVNLHFSLLPRWRGAAPVQAAIREGDHETGVTCIVLDEGMDTGPVLRTAATMIGPGETSGQLLERLAVLGAPTLVSALRGLLAGEEPIAQPIEGATVAGKIHPADVAIDFGQSASRIERLVRSANPAPGAHTLFRGKRLKIWSVALQLGRRGAPGEIIERGDRGVIVACGQDALVLTNVQPEGKQAMDGATFGNGYQPTSTDRLGQ